MKHKNQEAQEVTSWCDNRNPALSESDMGGVVYNGSHGIACKRREKHKRYYGVIDMIVFFEIWN